MHFVDNHNPEAGSFVEVGNHHLVVDNHFSEEGSHLPEVGNHLFVVGNLEVVDMDEGLVVAVVVGIGDTPQVLVHILGCIVVHFPNKEKK